MQADELIYEREHIGVKRFFDLSETHAPFIYGPEAQAGKLLWSAFLPVWSGFCQRLQILGHDDFENKLVHQIDRRCLCKQTESGDFDIALFRSVTQDLEQELAGLHISDQSPAYRYSVCRLHPLIVHLFAKPGFYLPRRDLHDSEGFLRFIWGARIGITGMGNSITEPSIDALLAFVCVRFNVSSLWEVPKITLAELGAVILPWIQGFDRMVKFPWEVTTASSTLPSP